MQNIEELQSKTGEAGIISTLLYRPEFIHYSEALTPKHFCDKTNACIFWAIKKLTDQGSTIDTFAIANMLSSNEAVKKKFEQISDKSIHELFELCEITARTKVEDYKALVHEVQSLALRRSLYSGLKNSESICLNTAIDNDAVLSDVYQQIEKTNSEFSLIKDIKPMAEKVRAIWGEIRDRQLGKIITVPFKFSPTLNDYVELEAGELIIIGGYNKVGKSAILLNVAVELLERGETVLYIDSELSDRLFTLRLVAYLTGLPFKYVKDGVGLTVEENTRINDALNKIESFHLYHEYLPVCGVNDLVTTTRRVNAAQKIDTVVVDYFKSSDGTDAYAVSRELAIMVNVVKNELLGTIPNLKGIGAVQTKENGEVALSKEVGRYCSTLIKLRKKTPDMIDQDGYECGTHYMQVSLNRNGGQHNEDEYIDLLYQGNILKFSEAKQHGDSGTPF